MTVQEKLQAIMRHYSQASIARKLTDISGRKVPLSTINGYIRKSSTNKNIRVKEVAEALDQLYEEVKEL